VASDVSSKQTSSTPEEVNLLNSQNLEDECRKVCSKKISRKRKLHSDLDGPSETLIQPEPGNVPPKKGLLDSPKKKTVKRKSSIRKSNKTKKDSPDVCQCDDEGDSVKPPSKPTAKKHTSLKTMDESTSEVKESCAEPQTKAKTTRRCSVPTSMNTEQSCEQKAAVSLNRRKSMRVASRQDSPELSESASQVKTIKSSRRVTEEFQAPGLLFAKAKSKSSRSRLNSSSSSNCSTSSESSSKKKKQKRWKEIFLPEDTSYVKPKKSLVTTSLHFE
jgi:hypothetical protein